jgi:hypothetical protein
LKTKRFRGVCNKIKVGLRVHISTLVFQANLG